jgi:hypothetical protein
MNDKQDLLAAVTALVNAHGYRAVLEKLALSVKMAAAENPTAFVADAYFDASGRMYDALRAINKDETKPSRRKRTGGAS